MESVTWPRLKAARPEKGWPLLAVIPTAPASRDDKKALLDTQSLAEASVAFLPPVRFLIVVIVGIAPLGYISRSARTTTLESLR